MKSSSVTVVPAFTLVESKSSAYEGPISRATIVPAFNLEQYARALGSAITVLGDLPALEAAFCTPAVTLAPPADEYASEDSAETVCPPCNPELDWLLDETPTRSGQKGRAASLSHRAAFLLMHVDGVSTVREILEQCGLVREEALRALADLIHVGEIVFAAPAPRSEIRERSVCSVEVEG
jgi:hypothetical protein